MAVPSPNVSIGDLKIVTPVSTFVLNTLETLRNEMGGFHDGIPDRKGLER